MREPARRRKVARVPFVGLTGGLGAGKSTALAALERLGAATLSTDAVVHELYGSAEVRDAVVARWGAEVAPGGIVDRVGRSRRTPSPIPASAPGSRASCGRASARASRPGARRSHAREPAAGGGGRRDAAAVRGRHGGHLRRDDRGRRRRGRARRARRRARARRHDERAARQLTQEEKARRATFTVANSGTVEELERQLSAVLARLTSAMSTRTGASHAGRRPHARRAAAARRAPAPAPPRLAGRARSACCRRCSRSSSCRGCPTPCAELALPLRHEDIIRQQAARQGARPVARRRRHLRRVALPRPDLASAGARGLMQITPRTARYIAQAVRRHGVRAGRPRDAADQHLLRRVLPALPARALRRQRGARARRLQRRRGQRRPLDRRGEPCPSAPSRSTQIPFAETREYVGRVLDARQRYRQNTAASWGSEPAAACPVAAAGAGAIVNRPCRRSSSTTSSRPPPTSRRRSREIAAGGARRRPLHDAARRHRHRQDDDDGGRHRRSCSARRSCSRTTRRSPRSCATSSARSSPTTRSSTSSPTTTTTSPRRTSRSRDLYIEKDSAINEEVDRLRHAATAALFARRDVIIVASASARSSASARPRPTR